MIPRHYVKSYLSFREPLLSNVSRDSTRRTPGYACAFLNRIHPFNSPPISVRMISSYPLQHPEHHHYNYHNHQRKQQHRPMSSFDQAPSSPLLHPSFVELDPNISPSELSELNRTSLQLYRILIRSCRLLSSRQSQRCQKGSNEDDLRSPSSSESPTTALGRDGYFNAKYVTVKDEEESDATVNVNSNGGEKINKCGVFLQSPLNPGAEYGNANILDSEPRIHWYDDDDSDNRSAVAFARIKSFLRQIINQTGEGGNANSEVDHLLVPRDKLRETITNAFLRVPKGGGKVNAPDFNFLSNIDNTVTTFTDTVDIGDPSTVITLTKGDIVRLQRSVIDITRKLREQEALWQRTSVSVDWERRVRVVATSTCINSSRGTGVNGTRKNQFAYRIRVENFRTPQHNDDLLNDGNEEKEQRSSVQLLGRTWRIVEEHEKSKVDHGSNMDDDNLANMKQPKSDKTTVVDAPVHGVVGHHPVIHPGQHFEYMSGCELETKIGHMFGHFHMAMVPSDTKYGFVGERIDAIIDDKKRHKFRIPVHPFALMADDFKS